MKKTVIKGTGRYVPERVVTNEDLVQWMDTSDEWITQRTGIKQRHWIPEAGGTCSSDLGFEASKIALDRAGWKPEDIDFIIFATLSPDLDAPGAGCLVQHKLGLKATPALDIRQQCTGFIYGLATADAYIRSGLASRILFICAEVHSTLIDISTRGRDIATLFGDGAGAVCLEGIETEKPVGVLASVLHSQGEFAGSLMLKHPSSRYRQYYTEDIIKIERPRPYMDGKTIFKTAIRRLPEVANEAMDKAGLSIDEIDLIIPHQANLRINKAVEKSMDLPEGKIFNNMQRYGNTTAASIPIALDEAIEMNLVGSGSRVLFFGLGAGLTWGCVAYSFE